MSGKQLAQRRGEPLFIGVTVHELFASPVKLEAQERPA
jgi:hypothetical protein